MGKMKDLWISVTEQLTVEELIELLLDRIANTNGLAFVSQSKLSALAAQIFDEQRDRFRPDIPSFLKKNTPQPLPRAAFLKVEAFIDSALSKLEGAVDAVLVGDHPDRKPRELRDWYLTMDGYLFGNIYNDPRFPDMTFIKTSKVVLLDKVAKVAVTRSGTMYSLGNMLSPTV